MPVIPASAMPITGMLLPLAFGFVLILCRVSAAVMLLPGLGEAEIPAVVRAGLSVLLSVLLLPVVQPMLPALPTSPTGLLGLVAGEVLFGGSLGWLARLLGMTLPIAAQLMSTMIGLANVLQPDPALGAQTTGLSRMMSLAVPVLVLASGLYVLPIRALAGSYHVLRPGQFLQSGDLAALIVDDTAHCFAMAAQLAAPFIIAFALWQAMLGVLSRLVPSLQVGHLAAPAQLLGGLLLTGLLVRTIVSIWLGDLSDGFMGLPGLHWGAG